jgi:cysteine desulfurase
MTRSHTIYLDHAATTALDSRVLEAMLPYLTQNYGNPSSIYELGRTAKKALTSARETVATTLGARSNEILFTSGGSESDNLALKGIAEAYAGKGNHIITSSVEHHAISHTAKYLETRGYHVTYLPVDSTGMVNPDDVASAITDNTILVSIMYANNEVGTIQPIADIGRICKEKGVLFHTDAVQATGSLPINVKDLGVDLLSLSAHKFYGPKGTGALYVKGGVRLASQVHGGPQEHSKRAGTENVAGIVGLAEALRLAYENLDAQTAHASKLRNRIIETVISNIPDAQLTGHPTKRLPNSASFVFAHVNAESILLRLDALGIAASSGSACNSAQKESSHVLVAMGLSAEIARGAFRLTVGNENTEADIVYMLKELQMIIADIRAAAL